MKKRVVCFIVSIAILSLFQLSVYAEGTVATNEYYFKRNDKNLIALTFDDGPHPKYTYKILDILRKYDIKATFFIIGVNAKNYPEALRAIADEGHEIGNHTFTHQCMKGKSYDQISRDVSACSKLIYDLCGKTPSVFRPPGGIMADAEAAASDLFENYKIVYWSIDTMDWDHHTPENIFNYVVKNIKAGDIILMHDYIGYNTPTPRALELIIPKLLESGYEFVTVSELLS